MQFMKHAMQNTVANRGLKYVLHKQLRRSDPARSHKTVHASDVTGGAKRPFCPRAYAILDKVHHQLENKPTEFLTASMAVTFEIGKMVQDHIIHVLSDGGAAVTNWVCTHCKSHYVRCKRPVECETCHGKTFKPEEIRLISAKSGISCGFDVFASLGDGKLCITELKTIDPAEFKTLIAPLAEHRLRTNLYMRIAEESDDPWKDRIDVEKARVLYVSKGGYGCMDGQLVQWGINDKFSPFKEFTIFRDDKATEPYVAPAVRLMEFRDGVKGMPSGICNTAFDKSAKSCPVATHCFSGSFPAKD
jgi:hypothetical protein